MLHFIIAVFFVLGILWLAVGCFFYMSVNDHVPVTDFLPTNKKHLTLALACGPIAWGIFICQTADWAFSTESLKKMASRIKPNKD